MCNIWHYVLLTAKTNNRYICQYLYNKDKSLYRSSALYANSTKLFWFFFISFSQFIDFIKKGVCFLDFSFQVDFNDIFSPTWIPERQVWKFEIVFFSGDERKINDYGLKKFQTLSVIFFPVTKSLLSFCSNKFLA